MATSIEVLTLNCWGLKYISAHRHARLSEIGHQLATRSPAPDVVGLQECWTQADYLAIRDHTRHILPYGKFYYGGIFGAGLVILSRWPIIESNMVAYPLNGRPTAFFRGDWFVGKGVACAKIKYGQWDHDVMEVFCTHLHAPYEQEPRDSYLCHRTAQAWEIAKLMRNAIERGHLTIALGDFNMRPLSLAHQIITTHAPVHDAWLTRHPELIEHQKMNWPEPHTLFYNVTVAGTTCDSAVNTWRWPKREQRALMKKVKKAGGGGDEGESWPEGVMERGAAMHDPYAKRLDYIFIGAPSMSRSRIQASVATSEERGTRATAMHGTSQDAEQDSAPNEGELNARRRGQAANQEQPTTPVKEGTTEWRLSDIKIGFIQRHPTLLCSLSDHFSIEASLCISSNTDFPPITSPPPTSGAGGVETGLVEGPSSPPAPRRADDLVPGGDISHSQPPSPRKQHYLHPQIYDEILHLTHTYVLRERRQRRYRLAHFGAQLCITITCWVGIWFSSGSNSLTSRQRGAIGFMLMLFSSLGLVAGVIDGLIGGLFVSGELRALKEFEWEIRNAKERALEYFGGAGEGSREGGSERGLVEGSG